MEQTSLKIGINLPSDERLPVMSLQNRSFPMRSTSASSVRSSLPTSAMQTGSEYWTLIRLTAAGQVKREASAIAQRFFHQQFSQFLSEEDLKHVVIQEQLWQVSRDTDSADHDAAELCLRCFISFQIERTCTQLETQFGQNYGFSRSDLFPFVLNDDGRTLIGQSFAGQILQKFDPERGSLTSWTVRLVKHDRSLNAFLLECGLYLISDWAILNDTKLDNLQKIFSKFYQRTAAEIEQAAVLLESYRAVYLRDRLQQRVTGQCSTPTEQQLQEIGKLVQQKTKHPSPLSILVQLQDLAALLRQYRIAARTKKLPTEPPGEYEPSIQSDESEKDQEDFLRSYRQGFRTCLEQALAHVIEDKLQQKKPQKAQDFIIALRLFHCQGLPMGEIAKQVGLKAQFQVSRLLKLDEFRSDVRQRLLKSLRDWVLDKAEEYVHPDQLQELDSKVELALSEQVEAVMQDAARQAKTPKAYASGTLFSRSVCRYLDDKNFDLNH